jgi:hypothetical protein
LIAVSAGLDAGHEVGEGLGEADRQRGDRSDPGEPGHPADLEADQAAEGGPGVEVGAPGLLEPAGGLGEAEHQEEDGEAGEAHRPEARRAEEGGRGGRQEIHAAPDDVVERQADDLPAGDRAPQGRPAGAGNRSGRGHGGSVQGVAQPMHRPRYRGRSKPASSPGNGSRDRDRIDD